MVEQTRTDDDVYVVSDSVDALRYVFDDDGAFREFLSSLFETPRGAEKYSVEAY